MARTLQAWKFAVRSERQPPLRTAFRRKRHSSFRACQWTITRLRQILRQIDQEDFRYSFALRSHHTALESQCSPLPGSTRELVSFRPHPTVLIGFLDCVFTSLCFGKNCVHVATA